jgi:FAD/FMN-containing dehydrogenase
MAFASGVKLELEKIVGVGNVRDEDYVLTAYATDISEIPPSKADAVVLPESKEEVSAILKLANERKIPVTPRASNTLGFGVGLAQGGILLDLGKMDGILRIEEDLMTATAQAGCGAYKLFQAVNKRGLDIPVRPWFGSGPSIGSWIAATGTGARVHRYGHCQEWVCGLEVVLATGEIIQTGAGQYENHSNYLHRGGSGNLMNLFQMTFGTLGVITEVTVGLIPLPETTISVCYGFNDMESFIKAAYDIQRADAATDIEHEDGDLYNHFLEMSEPYPFVLCITNQGHEKEAKARTEVVSRICEDLGGHALPDKFAKATWDNAATFDYRTTHFGRYTLAAASCSYRSYEKAYRIIKDTFAKYNIKNAWSGWSCWPAWVEGWAVAYYNPETQLEDMQKAKFEITKKCADLPDYFFNSVRAPYEDLLVRIKNMIDPNNIMNPSTWDFVTGAPFKAIRNIPLEQ